MNKIITNKYNRNVEVSIFNDKLFTKNVPEI